MIKSTKAKPKLADPRPAEHSKPEFLVPQELIDEIEEVLRKTTRGIKNTSPDYQGTNDDYSI